MLPEKINPKISSLIIYSLLSFVLIMLACANYYFYNQNSVKKEKIEKLTGNLEMAQAKNSVSEKNLVQIEKALKELQSQDQYLINKKLNEENKDIHEGFLSALNTYEHLLDYKAFGKKPEEMDKMFASSLALLSERNYSSASSVISSLDKSIEEEKNKYLASLVPTRPPVPQSNNPPDSGYAFQSVQTDAGNFNVAIVTGNLDSTKVIVDTASDSDCRDNCPVLPLGDYVSRSGAYAGVNGTYFCPATYPSCAGKTNSFDLLVMNKNKKYFNSDNNVYSTNPGVAFLGNSVRFLDQTLGWGRDTGVDGYLSNFPLLVNGGNIVYGGDNDPKHNNKGGRSFVAAKDNKVYIGVVFNATVMESAKVMKALGMSGALNLDDGGSTALWFQGYKAGPGRNIPNAVLFVRK